MSWKRKPPQVNYSNLLIRKENADEGEEVEIEDMGFKDYEKEREQGQKKGKETEGVGERKSDIFIHLCCSLGHQCCAVS